MPWKLYKYIRNFHAELQQLPFRTIVSVVIISKQRKLMSASECENEAIYWQNIFPEAVFDEQIASSSSMTLWKAQIPSTNRIVAVKITHLHVETDPQPALSQKQALQFMASSRLKGFIEISVTCTQEYCAQLMKFMKSSLAEYIETQFEIKVKRYSEGHINRVKFIIRQVLQALQLLHAAGFTHGDLKPSNILITNKGNLEIADFGTLSKVSSFESTLKGTITYSSPQRISDKRGSVPVDPSLDIWSLGVMSYELIHGWLPFEGSNTENVYENIYLTANGIQGRFTQLNENESIISNFVSQCLQIDPQMRPTATTLLLHPWLACVNLSNLN